MLIDFMVPAFQAIAFGFIGFGCVLCLWAVALDAQETDIEHARDASLSPRDALDSGDAPAGNVVPPQFVPIIAGCGIRDAGSVSIRRVSGDSAGSAA